MMLCFIRDIKNSIHEAFLGKSPFLDCGIGLALMFGLPSLYCLMPALDLVATNECTCFLI